MSDLDKGQEIIVVRQEEGQREAALLASEVIESPKMVSLIMAAQFEDDAIMLAKFDNGRNPRKCPEKFNGNFIRCTALL